MRNIQQNTDGFEDGRGHKPRNAGVLLKVGKKAREHSALGPPEGIQFC